MQALNIADGVEVSKLRICGRHFAKNMISAVSKTLLGNAIPHPIEIQSVEIIAPPVHRDIDEIAEPGIDEPVSMDSESIGVSVMQVDQMVQTSPPQNVMHQTSAKIKNLKHKLISLRAENKNLKQKNKRVKLYRRNEMDSQPSINVFKTMCEKFLRPSVCEIVIAQLNNKQYTRNLKEIALKLYFASPKAYDVLRTYLRMPCRNTLCNEFAGMTIEPGLNDRFLEAMRVKLGSIVNPLYKYCVISIDEMSLREHLKYDMKRDEVIGLTGFNDLSMTESIANHSTTIMVQGLFEKWKQPIGYWFVKSALRAPESIEIVHSVITALFAIGFVVKAVISDQGSNFQKLAKVLGTNVDEPFFILNGEESQKIWYIFDPPHLLKNTRNCLLKNNFRNKKQPEHVISWTYIKQFYELDKKKDRYRSAPKISDVHIDPKDREKMKVRYAAEILSATIARSLNDHVQQGLLEKSASHTAEFISNIDNLFDVFNSKEIIHDFKKFNSAYCGAVYQVEFLEYMKNYIEELDVINCEGKIITGRFKFLNGWKHNINAIIQLWQSFDNDIDNISHILTRRINQDPLENFFGAIRSAGGNNQTPSCGDFTNHFKKLAFNCLFKHSDGNCEADLDSLLLTELEKIPETEDVDEIEEDDFSGLSPNSMYISYLCSFNICIFFSLYFNVCACILIIIQFFVFKTKCNRYFKSLDNDYDTKSQKLYILFMLKYRKKINCDNKIIEFYVVLYQIKSSNGSNLSLKTKIILIIISNL